MRFENFSSTPKEQPYSEIRKLAHNFQELPTHPNSESHVFENLESDLKEENFELATNIDVSEVFNDQSLLCRSETFSRVMDLLLSKNPLAVNHKLGEANMCVMATGAGFRTAMHEGFSGKDVGGIVKVVLSFKDTHLIKRENLTRDNKLWDSKPDTARVSLSGSGHIEFEDIEMVSFRFPIRYFPEDLLTEVEQDNLEAGGIKFVVRHYIPSTKKALH
jgi:hypothetical protein